MIRRALTVSFAIMSAILAFVPESIFRFKTWISNETISEYEIFNQPGDFNIVINRLLTFATIIAVTMLTLVIKKHVCKKNTIKGNNYKISIEYGDLFKTEKRKTVIHFDECFTTQIGNVPADIKASSICGQYLENNRNINIPKLIAEYKIKPMRTKSKYNKQLRYESETIVPNDDSFLMAFAKLNKDGKAYMTRDNYTKCLDLMWREIHKYNTQMDVCIPIFGAGITHFDESSGASLSQQELLQIILDSYKLSSYKIKLPNMLRIICKENEDFSIFDCRA